MSGLIALVDGLTDWTRENVCSKIELKKKGDAADKSYVYKLVNPTAFPVYCLPDDKNRTAAPQVPSVTVQLDKFVTGGDEGDADVAMIFAVWNPGEHDNSDPEDKKFTKTPDGWRDLLSFMDKALYALKKHLDVGGYLLSSKITARQLHGDESLMGTYPYYYGEITFSVSNRIGAVNEAIEKLL